MAQATARMTMNKRLANAPSAMLRAGRFVASTKEPPMETLLILFLAIAFAALSVPSMVNSS